MAYNQGQGQRSFGGNRSNNNGAAGGAQQQQYRKPAAGGDAKKVYEEDPTKVGIAYEKEMKSGEKYLSVTLTKDVPVGTKLSIFPNSKVKNRTEKTPTHIVKLQVKKS